MAARRHITKLYFELFDQKSQLIPLFRLIWCSGVHLSGYFDNISNYWHIKILRMCSCRSTVKWRHTFEGTWIWRCFIFIPLSHHAFSRCGSTAITNIFFRRQNLMSTDDVYTMIHHFELPIFWSAQLLSRDLSAFAGLNFPGQILLFYVGQIIYKTP